MTSEALKRKIKKTTAYEKTQYFKWLVRFPKPLEDGIREAALIRDPEKGSINGFIVDAVREKIERELKNQVESVS